MQSQLQSHTQAQSSASLRVAGRFLQCLILLLLLPLSAALAPRAATAQVPVQTDYRYDPAGNLKSVTVQPAKPTLPTLTLSLSFGNVPVGSPVTAQALLNNATGAALAVTQPNAASVSGAGFSFQSTNCGVSLPDGQTCSISVQFKPTVVGEVKGSLKLKAGSATLSTALLGTGQGNSTASTAVVVGAGPTLESRWVADSRPLSTGLVTFRNDGDSPMTLTGLSGLPARVFLSSNNCTAVPKNSQCQMVLELKVAPLSIVGTGPISLTTVGATVNANFVATANLFASFNQWNIQHWIVVLLPIL